jgi:hypothetical protein
VDNRKALWTDALTLLLATTYLGLQGCGGSEAGIALDVIGPSSVGYCSATRYVAQVDGVPVNATWSVSGGGSMSSSGNGLAFFHPDKAGGSYQVIAHAKSGSRGALSIVVGPVLGGWRNTSGEGIVVFYDDAGEKVLIYESFGGNRTFKISEGTVFHSLETGGPALLGTVAGDQMSLDLVQGGHIDAARFCP